MAFDFSLTTYCAHQSPPTSSPVRNEVSAAALLMIHLELGRDCDTWSWDGEGVPLKVLLDLHCGYGVSGLPYIAWRDAGRGLDSAVQCYAKLFPGQNFSRVTPLRPSLSLCNYA